MSRQNTPLITPRAAEIRAGQRLRWRMVTVLLAASLLPLALVGIGAWVAIGGLLMDEALQRHREMIRGHAATIELYLAERLRALEMVARSHSRVALGEPMELRRAFSLLSKTYPQAFLDLGVIDRSGRHLAYVGPYALQDKNYAEAPWFEVALTQGAYVSEVFLGYRQVPHCIIAVKSGEGADAWILRGTVDSQSFAALVKRSVFGQNGDIFIIDRAGLYQTPARSGVVLTAANIPLPPLDEDIRHSHVEVDGTHILRATQWINQGRWLLVVQQAEAEIMSPVNQALLRGVIAVFIAMGLMVGTTILATRYLTDRIDQAQRERDEAHRDFIRSAKLASLGEMATGLAHEINNPLAIISVELTNFRDQLAETVPPVSCYERLVVSLDRCRRQVSRCAVITCKMLQFARSNDGPGAPTAVGEVINEVQQLLGRQAEVRNIDIRTVVDTDLPLLLLNRNELEQVLVNLINNAMQAIAGQVDQRGLIEVSARRAEDEIELVVKDNGSGILAENIDRIFHPFFTTKPVGEGTGLGLSVCYGLVHGWGGRITAASEPGAGATMTIRLPVASRQENHDGRRPAGEMKGVHRC